MGKRRQPEVFSDEKPIPVSQRPGYHEITCKEDLIELFGSAQRIYDILTSFDHSPLAERKPIAGTMSAPLGDI